MNKKVIAIITIVIILVATAAVGVFFFLQKSNNFNQENNPKKFQESSDADSGNGNANSNACGTSTVSYGGQTYNTVQIGTQCWFKENLNVGTMLASALAMPADPAPTLNNPNTVSKWCYDNSTTNCTNEGGLYTWAEANGLASTCNSTSCTPASPSQGICPTGWHIPTDAEQYTLENYLKTSGQTCDANRVGWDCSDAGTELKAGCSSGFNAPLAGNRDVEGSFDYRSSSTYFWSSSASDASSAWYRLLSSDFATVYRHDGKTKAYGFSVRCLKN